MCYKLAQTGSRRSSHVFTKVGGTFVVAKNPGVVSFAPQSGASFVHEDTPIRLTRCDLPLPPLTPSGMQHGRRL